MRTCDLETVRACFEQQLQKMYPELLPEDGTVRVRLTYLDEDSPAEAVLYATVSGGKLVSMEWQQ
jgi:hypothetical protein